MAKKASKPVKKKKVTAHRHKVGVPVAPPTLPDCTGLGNGNYRLRLTVNAQGCTTSWQAE